MKTSRRIIIVGGVAGGASAAAKARRVDEHAEIHVFERGPYISFANCGLPYFISGEINSKVADVPRALKLIEERYQDGRVTKLDGVSVDYDTWHFNVRGSNTEPLLRLNLEAYSQNEMEQRRDEVLELLRS